MLYKYSNTEEIFRAEKDRADKFTRLYQEMEGPMEELKSKCARLEK